MSWWWTTRKRSLSRTDRRVPRRVTNGDSNRATNSVPLMPAAPPSCQLRIDSKEWNPVSATTPVFLGFCLYAIDTATRRILWTPRE